MSTPFDWLFGLEHFGIKFGLAGIETLVASLGHPERACPTVHIAGTNGKGSVTAMVHAALCEAGHRAARYTSPHLLALNERFVIGESAITDAALGAVLTRLRSRIDALLAEGLLDGHPTFFEVTTAAAFEAFRDAGIDIGIFEVGLGGRLDATNVLTPAVSAITSIAFDHEQYLGTTLASIAAEKAGIIKPGVPVVVGDLPSEALDVVAATAARQSAPLILASDGGTATRVALGPPQQVRLRTAVRDYGDVPLALAGRHQLDNALVAVRVLETLETLGTKVGEPAIRHALATVRWPGRLEHRQWADGRDAVFDAAHNPAGAATLASYLQEIGGPRPLVFAAMRDKDISGMVRALAPAISVLIVTRTSNPRSDTPEVLAERIRTLAPTLPVIVAARPGDAMAAAWRTSSSIAVAGSIFLLADVFAELGTS